MQMNDIMRQIAKSFEQPVIFILLLFVIFTIIMIGDLIAEVLQRKYLNIKLSKLVNDIRKEELPPEVLIYKAKLLKLQKDTLLEISDNKELSNQMRETLAIALLEKYKLKLDTKIKKSDLLAKLGPSFGLLGTLIPLGPGIIALGQGNTEILSQSLLTAFDTTILGLSCAVVAIVISAIRRRWYTHDMSIMNVLMEALVESENAKRGTNYVK
ncbi:MAG: MotA/TolQ/ExbB proton channel family protein [Eubacteriales bacterium]|nr:MotA/TolQ/ExbB proton channel family protein [Eubacteriales bacterium]